MLSDSYLFILSAASTFRLLCAVDVYGYFYFTFDAIRHDGDAASKHSLARASALTRM